MRQTDVQLSASVRRLGKTGKLCFRRYNSSDKEACLRIFRSNVPDFFTDGDEADFEYYVDKYAEAVFLIENESRDILACGGIGQKIAGEASLCWGMVLRSSHNHGIGRLLLLGRLGEVARRPDIKVVRMNTSQLTDGFYRKFGFVTESVQKDQFAPGVDCYAMSLTMSDDTRSKLLSQWQDVTD